MDSKKMMKDNVVYNKFDNEVMVKTNGDYIYIVCKEEDQVQPVMDPNAGCPAKRADIRYIKYDDENMKWILTFKVLDELDEYPEKN